MVWNDELVCPGCGGTVCDRMADWMMQDGQSRTFHCDECGTALFGHVAEALENEPDSTIRPFMEGMARALATASHVAASLNVPAMLDWLDSRDTKGETPGETCVYGDLIRLYTYLSDLCGHKASRMGGQAGRALGAVSDELAGMLREVGA